MNAPRLLVGFLAIALCPGCGLKVRKLSAGVWALVGEKGQANSGVIRTEHGPVVIDTQLTPESARSLREQARKLTGWEDVAYVINTSHLPEHAFGNTIFAKAEIIGHRHMRRDLLARGPALLKRLQNTDRRLDGLKDTRLAAPSMTFEKRTAIHAPDRTVQVIHLGPGLTPGDSVVLLPEQKIVFTGDLICLKTLPWFEQADTSAWRPWTAWKP